MSSVQEQYNDVMSSEDDDVEMVDSENVSATVGCAPTTISIGKKGNNSKKSRLRSDVWDFFDRVKEKDGTEKGVCKACKFGYKYESSKGGTSSMRRHVCPQRQSKDIGQMMLSAKNGQLSTRVRKFDQMKFRDLLSTLLIARNVPFSLVEWKEFRDICRMCLTSDMWTSVTTTGYISLTVHYLDQNWELKKYLLNFCELPPPHTALIVKDGLVKIDPAVLKIRKSVKSLKKSQVEFNLSHVGQLSCFRVVFAHLKEVDPDYEDCPTDEEWGKLKLSQSFSRHFDLTDFIFWEMVKEMQEKFNSYWTNLSPILSIALVLDPRYKLHYLNFAYSKLYPDVRVLERKVNDVRDEMKKLYNEYCIFSRASGIGTQNLGTQTDGNSAHQGSEWYEEYAAAQENGGGDLQSDLSELDLYLSEKHPCQRNPSFDILMYWKGQEQRFPVLSRMAGDILSIPISTVASESAFSIGGRVIDRFRSSLLPENAEAVITTRDWDLGVGKEDLDEENGLIGEDVLGFELGVLEDEALEDGEIHNND
ncbi:zinc finger BED domain-containing protein DAYSLEEPER-like [Papaver somniferum]|uniref:zinc finger BED domain-containing protein DAYSLEEPER-like n=1 Tax=Papaver somniferum TaxID=3469 RepID=UPI000E6FCC99|nr:zinc finger BED domain-containing protein DAYSLEEPER-like [Papaver somniferum]